MKKLLVVLSGLVLFFGSVSAQGNEPSVDAVLQYKDSVIVAQSAQIVEQDSVIQSQKDRIIGLDLMLTVYRTESASDDRRDNRHSGYVSLWVVIIFVMFSVAAMFIFGYLYAKNKVNKKYSNNQY